MEIAGFSGSGNGFALRSRGREHRGPDLSNSAAWKNGGYGFTEAANRGALTLANNTAFRNVKDGFAPFYSPSMLQRNLALGNSRQAVLAATAAKTGNSWNQGGWNDAALREVDPASAEAPRDPDGSLPDISYPDQRQGHRRRRAECADGPPRSRCQPRHRCPATTRCRLHRPALGIAGPDPTESASGRRCSVVAGWPCRCR